MLDQEKPDGGLKRTRVEAAATAAELRAFIASMKGRSPQEMLGAVAQSSLVRATIEMSVWTLVLITVFTLGPYLLKSKSPKDTTSNQAQKAVAEKAAKPAAKADREPSKTEPSQPETPDLQRAAKAMGLDETKTADPKTNPREKDLDSLLDSVK